jgi:hypothetical protein
MTFQRKCVTILPGRWHTVEHELLSDRSLPRPRVTVWLDELTASMSLEAFVLFFSESAAAAYRECVPDRLAGTSGTGGIETRLDGRNAVLKVRLAAARCVGICLSGTVGFDCRFGVSINRRMCQGKFIDANRKGLYEAPIECVTSFAAGILRKVRNGG